jgi:hypothetical protein
MEENQTEKNYVEIVVRPTFYVAIFANYYSYCITYSKYIQNTYITNAYNMEIDCWWHGRLQNTLWKPLIKDLKKREDYRVS